jgi:hypothetical protein
LKLKSSDGSIEFLDQSSTVAFSSITNWP